MGSGDENYNFWSPEMAHDMILDPTYFWFTRIFDTLSAIIIFIILCRHSWVVYDHCREHDLTRHITSRSITRRNSRTNTINSTTGRQRTKRSIDLSSRITANWTLTLNTLTILFIIFSLITILMLMLNIWTVFPKDYDCDINVEILCIAFHLSKALFYSILIARLQVAFGTSEMGYSKYTIYGLFVFVSVYTVFIVIGTPYMVEGAYVDTVFKSDHPWCHVHIRGNLTTMDQIGILLWIFMDMLISVLLLYLFHHPITKLLRLFPDSANQTRVKFTHLIMKNMILCWMSIIASALATVLYLWRHIATLIEINLPFVCICAVLMHIKYDNAFKLLCRPVICCYQFSMKGDGNKSNVTTQKDGEYPSVDSVDPNCERMKTVDSNSVAPKPKMIVVTEHRMRPSTVEEVDVDENETPIGVAADCGPVTPFSAPIDEDVNIAIDEMGTPRAVDS